MSTTPHVFVIVLIAIFTIPMSAQNEAPRIQRVAIDKSGELIIRYSSNEDSYYLLKRGAALESLDSTIDAALGIDGSAEFSDSLPPDSASSYYVIRTVAVNAPLDTPISGEDGGTIAFANANLIRASLELTTDGFITGDTLTTAVGSAVTGTGAIDANLKNQSTLTLNSNAGPVVIEGDLILDTNSVLEITIGLGANFTDSGVIEVAGNATLGGTLKIVPRTTYNPQVGDSFEIVHYGSKLPAFAQTTGLMLKNGMLGVLEITDTKITLNVVAQP